MLDWFKRLFASRSPRLPTPCPYCPNLDRDSVLDGYEGCQYDSAAAAANGIIGADPPCICDGYFTPRELKRHLGLAS